MLTNCCWVSVILVCYIRQGWITHIRSHDPGFDLLTACLRLVVDFCSEDISWFQSFATDQIVDLQLAVE